MSAAAPPLRLVRTRSGTRECDASAAGVKGRDERLVRPCRFPPSLFVALVEAGNDRGERRGIAPADTRAGEAVMSSTHAQHPKPNGALLWGLQALLATVFLLAGGMKLFLPAAALAQQTPVPVAFLRSIGACEVLDALGLVLPGLLRIRTELTSRAAGGLVIIMIGATGATVATGALLPALVPLVLALLAGTVARGRWGWAPAPRGTHHAVLHPAR